VIPQERARKKLEEKERKATAQDKLHDAAKSNDVELAKRCISDGEN
jgi:hypothetical protein